MHGASYTSIAANHHTPTGNSIRMCSCFAAVLRPAAADIPVRAVDMEDKYITIQQYKEEADALYQVGATLLAEVVQKQLDALIRGSLHPPSLLEL